MALDKIKARNLDEDVFLTFRNAKDKLTYDDLDPDIVTAIKNGTGTQLYNDTELRTRVISLETNKLDKSAATDTYRTISSSYSKNDIDTKISDCNSKIDLKLTESKADTKYVLNKNGVITESLLSDDLKNKVNARYENKRPESTASDSGNISDSEFNMLKNQVNTNTTNITNVQNYINTSVITVNDKIGKDNLESPIVDIINSARLKTTLIAITDLDDDIKKRLNNTAAGSYVQLEENIATNTENINQLTEFLNLQPGEVVIGAEKKISSPKGPVVKHGSIFAGNIWIVPDSTKINQAMEAALADDVNYLIVIFDEETCKLYAYENDSWTIKEQESPTGLLAGRFAREYGTDNIYFGFDKDDFDMIINISELATKSELTNHINTAKSTYAAKNDLSALQTKVSNLSTNLTAATTDISSIQTQVSQIQADIASLTTRIQTLETKVK